MTNIEDVLLFQIDKTSKVAKQYSQRVFDQLKIGITIDQWILLKIISESGPLSQKELSTISFRDPASITRTLDILEKKNYTLRSNVLGNRRTFNIELTKEGVSLIDKNFKIIKEMRNKSMEGFTSEELRVLTKSLKKIQENMS